MQFLHSDSAQCSYSSALGDSVKIGIYSVLTATATRPSEQLDRANSKCRQANVDIYINKKGDLEMFFPLADMLPCTEELIFGGSWFPMPEKFTLPDKLLQQLGPGASPVIPAGKYPVKKIRTGYIITF